MTDRVPRFRCINKGMLALWPGVQDDDEGAEATKRAEQMQGAVAALAHLSAVFSDDAAFARQVGRLAGRVSVACKPPAALANARVTVSV